MDRGEKEAVLSLVPYFDPYRVVVDAGSNKGEWSELLIENVDEMHLYEPNIKLLHYTEMKFDRLTNVHYHNVALYSEDAELDFYYFENENNGLSSIYCQDWPGLPMKQRKVQATTLPDMRIDFLKLDVEGAEYDVLKGAEKLLKERKIKFIQIETGHNKKGKEITELVTKYGYLIYRFEDGFKRTKIDDTKRENLYIMQEFTEDWNGEFKKNTQGMKFNFALEIGCFEGLTTCYICDFLLNPGGRIICVDPLKDEYLTDQVDEEAKRMNEEYKMFNGQYDRFIRNTKGKPVELFRDLSANVLPGFHAFRFDFIYIDGDHREGAVYQDAVMCWDILHEGGHILFDDYQWTATKKGINKFLKDYRTKLDIVVNDYQLMIRKK